MKIHKNILDKTDENRPGKIGDHQRRLPILFFIVRTITLKCVQEFSQL